MRRSGACLAPSATYTTAMCLIAIAWKADPRWPLVVAANRDEFRQRRSAPLARWPSSGLLAGRDLKQGGTWLGITDNGRFAALTNRRDLQAVPAHAPSRGKLVTDFLCSHHSASEYARSLLPQADDYAGFNLLVADPDALWYLGNAAEGPPRAVPAGVWALSNGSLDSSWPKMQRVRTRMQQILSYSATRQLETDLFKMLRDREPAADEHLPDTGVGRQLERMLSPVFINTPGYGTRSSAVVSVNANGTGQFVERRFNRRGHCSGQTRLSFQW